MSEIQRVKEQLHHLASESDKTAGGLSSFKVKFSQHSAQVLALIEGTSTGTDKDITEILHAAEAALEHAVEALRTASSGCRGYAEQA